MTQRQSLIDNMQKIFSLEIKIENIFFGYIFDYSKLGTYEYDKMLSKCERENLKYCFFNADKKFFVNSSNKKINSIYQIVSCPFINMINKLKVNYINITNYNVENYFKFDNSLSQKEKNAIINFLSSQTKTKIKDLEFFYRTDNVLIENNILNISIHPRRILFSYIYKKQYCHKLLERETYEIHNANFFEHNNDIYRIIYY